jgi:hypothetical protein
MCSVMCVDLHAGDVLGLLLGGEDSAATCGTGAGRSNTNDIARYYSTYGPREWEAFSKNR